MLSRSLDFSPARDAEIFNEVPAAAAVFLIRGDSGEPYVSKTANLKRRLVRLLGKPEEHTRKLSLRDVARTIEYSLTGSDFESQLTLYRAVRAVFPEKYRDKLKLRFAPLVRFLLENEYPRAYVTRRIASLKGGSVYYGPFPSRAIAEKFLNDSLDLFKIRRCDFEIHPDPKYPGCIYSEMKMCLAPCFAGCTPVEYSAEVSRVRAFLDTAGQSLIRELETQRERASEQLHFEQAAALHQRIEKIKAATHLPDIIRPLDRVSGVLVQTSAEKDCVCLFPVDAARLADPVAFSLQQHEGKMQSMESRLQQALGAAPRPTAASALERMEHLAILKRWYYRSSKVGELFLVDDSGELPYRKLVRGVSRVFRGEKAETDAMSTAAREYWLARTRETENPA
ncbi:MAG: UvrB/UvrC motif-containing protein [Acidobacteriia bacterium]|nr:UvrB/UvrC motif-containing protein [Terriglobia bacterium]